MKHFILFLLSFVIPTLIFSQSTDEVLKERNSGQESVVNNSPQSQLWRQVVQAKLSKNTDLYVQLLAQYSALYPTEQSAPVFNAPRAIGMGEQAPYSPDWSTGDFLVSGSVVSATSPGLPNRNGRQIRQRSDSLQNMFIVVNVLTQDTLKYYRSTDVGRTWTNFQNVTLNAGFKFHSFDYYITDSASAFRIGLVCSVTTSLISTNGTMYYLSMNTDGTNFRTAIVKSTSPGRGYISPAIISDGFFYVPAATYWYTTFQSADTATGLGVAALAAYSTDWGYTWIQDTVRNSFNDYDLDIDYVGAADTIMVSLANNVTATNPNLRLMRVALANIGPAGGSWTQNNIIATTSSEDQTSMAVNRQTNQICVTHRATLAGETDLKYGYGDFAGGTFTIANVSAIVGTAEDRGEVDCNQRQGAFRVAFVSKLTYDSVFYLNSVSLATGFGTKIFVNESRDADDLLFPSVSSIRRNDGTFGAGAAYVGQAGLRVYHDNSDQITGIGNNNTIPENYILYQNFPNPFNPETVIKYQLPVSGFVTLKIYDLSGRIVKELLSENQSAGSYSINFNGSSLGSGIYFYKLSSGSFSEVKKMMLIK